MLRRIALENFKSWRKLDIELAPITLLFGANSSGKTAILQSLLMLKQTAQGFDPGQHINFGGGDRDYVDLGSYREMVYGHETASNVGICLKWDTSQRVHNIIEESDNDRGARVHTLSAIRYHVQWAFSDRIYVDSLRYEAESGNTALLWVETTRDEENSYKMTSSLMSEDHQPEPVTAPNRCHGPPPNAKQTLGSYNNLWLIDLPGDLEQLFERVHYLRPLRISPNRHYIWTGGKPEIIEPDGANTVQALTASVKTDKSLFSHVARILKDLGLVDNFNLRPIDQDGRVFDATATIAGVESSITDVGFGVSQVLPVVTMLLSAPEGSIILLEQPELHLHPNAQAALADLLLYVAEKRNLQLIVESHSEHIVRRLQRRIAEAQPPFATPENIKMYYCESGKTGSTVSEVEVDRFGQISNWPERFMGDISGDIHSMAKAAIKRRRRELERVGSGG